MIDAQDEQLTRRVGLSALAALVLVIAFFVFVYGRVDWGARVRVRVYFHHVGALHEGAPFVAGGRTVGKIESIALVQAGSGPLGKDDGVAVIVSIAAREARGLDPRGDVFIASKGMFSERYLELGAATSGGSATPAAEAAGFHDGDQLVGRDPPSLDRVLQRTWDNLQDVGAFMTDVKPELDALLAQVDLLRAHFAPGSPNALPSVAELAPLFMDLGGLTGSIRALRETGLGGDAGLARAAEVVARAGAFAATARAALARLDAGSSALRANLAAASARLDAKGQSVLAAAELALDRLRADVAKLDPLLATVASIQQSLARGEGSLMKLGSDPEFPEDAKELGKILKRHPWKILDHPRNSQPPPNDGP